MSKTFDSKAENNFALKTKYKKIDYILPYLFTDGTNRTYRAKADFDPQDPRCPGLVLEFKAGKLNSLKCKDSSDKAISRRKASADMGYPPPANAHLVDGYNHALACKVEMQDTINALWYPVVFESAPSEKDAIRYVKAGLFFCTVETLSACLDAIAQARTGRSTCFEFSTEDYLVKFEKLHIHLLAAALQGKVMQ